MKVTAATLTRRRTHGPYEHEEITLTAELSLGTATETSQQLAELSLIAHKALYPEQYQSAEPSSKEVTQVETPAPAPAPKTRASRGAKANAETAAASAPAKEVNEQGQEIPPVIPSEAGANTGGASTVVGKVDTQNVTTVQQEAPAAGASVAGKGIVAYDSTVKEHRSRFANFLNTNYPKWTPDAQFGKTAEGQQPTPEKAAYAAKVTSFSKNLHGKPFEDAKGNMLESFKTELETFFAHAK